MCILCYQTVADHICQYYQPAQGLKSLGGETAQEGCTWLGEEKVTGSEQINKLSTV